MTTMMADRGRGDRAALAALGFALRTGDRELQEFLEESEEERKEAARSFLLCGDRESLAVLRLRESVAWSRLGRAEQAFLAAREAWSHIEGRAALSVQALVLTQLAETAAGRGDLSAAVRSARRAEALLVASGGAGTPQGLAVRAQLAALLHERGEVAESVLGRLGETLTALSGLATTPAAKGRLARLVEVFVDSARPPSWARCYCLGWRNVHA
jgi:ATP/maltotriose-dependent transcriptional regulator MalT